MDNRLPPRYAFRLEDLRAWHVELTPAALTRSRPGYTRLVDLEGRLRCRQCGARGGRRLRWNCGRGIE
jgi:hypothetical protein